MKKQNLFLLLTTLISIFLLVGVPSGKCGFTTLRNFQY